MQTGPDSTTVWSVYLIRCADGTLYTGIALDVDRRYAEHEAQGPRTARYLRGRAPLELVYSREIGSRSEALQVEYRIKRLPKREKEALVRESFRKSK